MYETKSAKLIGLLYLLPALLFVAAFTAWPFLQMLWVSLNNWTLISPPKFVGLSNFTKAFSDRQFWVSLGFTLQYTLYITPILMIGGYLLALLTAENTRLKRLTRTVVFMPVVIGLGASSLLWYWLFATDHGYINHILLSLALSPGRSSGWASTWISPIGRSSRRSSGRSSVSARSFSSPRSRRYPARSRKQASSTVPAIGNESGA
jgi:ABC-type sugar transport system permease subunit